MEALNIELWASIAVGVFMASMPVILFFYIKKKLKEGGENNDS